jgi:hypothetical protein
MIVVNIYWDKFEYSQTEIAKLSSPIDYGIYQIYGRHSAYGKDALLYIGQSNSQTFSKRLFQRWEFEESCAFPHTLRIGRIVKSKYPEDHLEWDESRWWEIINISEKLLLHTHAPAFNKQANSGLFDIKDEAKHIHIFNWGDFGDLLPEVSAYRYSLKYWSYEKPLST